MKKIFTLFMIALTLSSCGDGEMSQTEIEWRSEYDAYVEAIRFGEDTPHRNLLSWGQQDKAAEEGRRLAQLDEEKGTLKEYTTYIHWCRYCERPYSQNDLAEFDGCPECGNKLEQKKLTRMVKRYD